VQIKHRQNVVNNVLVKIVIMDGCTSPNSSTSELFLIVLTRQLLDKIHKHLGPYFTLCSVPTLLAPFYFPQTV